MNLRAAVNRIYSCRVEEEETFKEEILAILEMVEDEAYQKGFEAAKMHLKKVRK